MKHEMLIAEILLVIIDHLLRGDQVPSLYRARIDLTEVMDALRQSSTDGKP